MLRIFIVLTLLLSALACGRKGDEVREWSPQDHGQPPTDPSRTPQEAEMPSELQAAAAIWTISCSRCHGPKGQADGPERPPSVVMADLSSSEWQMARSDEEIATVIAKGRNLMPSFEKQIGAEGVQAMVQVVRSLGPAEKPEE
ncbi:MAG: cytochrome c [Myxococcales bacterium]|nr:MAG: cytochrome c [Myxococcales bacterium]